MKEKLEHKLLSFSKRRSTITLAELEDLFDESVTYEHFAKVITQAEEDKILSEVKTQGRNTRKASLAYRYRISRHRLNETYYKELQKYRHTFHQAINMDAYFSLHYKEWQEDFPYLKLIDKYLKEKGLPSEKAPAPERSFELVGNEKWIEEGGEDILRRVQLYDALNIYPVSDPLMFAMNPTHISEDTHYHLIVENKTTYQGLVPVLTQSPFSTLIYGAGNRVPKTIENFSTQFPVKGEHIFFYFGDIDRSGIEIWHRLHKRQASLPAVPFYKACFTKEKAFGKTNQQMKQESLCQFSKYFSEDMAENVSELLAEGAYYPQEVLPTKELQQILLTTDWHKVNSQLIKRKEFVT